MNFLKVIFTNMYYWLCDYSCPIFSPLYAPLPYTFPPPSIPLLSSCPWVIHISSLASPFSILFLTSPCLFCIYHLCFLFLIYVCTPILYSKFCILSLKGGLRSCVRFRPHKLWICSWSDFAPSVPIDLCCPSVGCGWLRCPVALWG